ncbi:MAG TPA: SRPBCC domain-containing protein [Gaiellaceae bacterium]|nr:SRPBCC domain-containing protein [Gaiellaceae bacterium]
MTGRTLRAVKLALVGIVAGGVVLALALLASAALDRPSKTITNEVTVEAPPGVVWRVLTDFGDYERWNPLITKAAGNARLGAQLDLQLDLPDDEREEISPEILVFKPDRKLRWQSRELVPGLADREYEAIIEELGDGRVRVFQQVRFEGIMTPLTPVDEEQVGLDLMAVALKERAEEAVPGTVVRTSEHWLCDRPLEDYGDLPIIVKSRIENSAAEAVTLNGPDCSGDGNPDTIDLVLEIEGDGGSLGPTADAVKVKLGAHDIDIAGFADCGEAPPGVRQNGIHVMLGYRITFVDFRLGDLATRSWTCDGAAGALSIEERSADDPEPEDVVCVRCEIVAGNRGLYIGDSVRSGARDSAFVSEREVFVEERAEEPVTAGNTWRPLDGRADGR